MPLCAHACTYCCARALAACHSQPRLHNTRTTLHHLPVCVLRSGIALEGEGKMHMREATCHCTPRSIGLSKLPHGSIKAPTDPLTAGATALSHSRCPSNYQSTPRCAFQSPRARFRPAGITTLPPPPRFAACHAHTNLPSGARARPVVHVKMRSRVSAEASASTSQNHSTCLATIDVRNDAQRHSNQHLL